MFLRQAIVKRMPKSLLQRKLCAQIYGMLGDAQANSAMLDVCGAETVKLSHHLQTLIHHTPGKLNVKRLIETSVVSPFIIIKRLYRR